MMRGTPKPRFPEDSLLASMLGEQAPVEARRAARRLRAEGAPAVAIDASIVALAQGLALSEVSRSPAVPDALPPLFWVEAPRESGTAAPGIRGWVVEKRAGGLAARSFGITFGQETVPEAEGTAAIRFGTGTAEEDEEARAVRGLVAAIALPEMLSQMGESSPVVLMPAEASDRDGSLLRGFRLSVAMPPDAAPS